VGTLDPLGEVAQSVEHTAENRGVAGSIPALAIAAAVVAALLVGCGGSSAEVVAPFQLGSGVSAGGPGIVGLDPEGITVQFVSHGVFDTGFTLRNRSSEVIDVIGVLPEEPHGALIHHIGTSLASWKPLPCPQDASCPLRPWPMSLDARGQPSPVTVKPGGWVAVGLVYRFGDCGRARAASLKTGRKLNVTYRTHDGKRLQQRLPLRSARIILEMTTVCDTS
jgi:hypothetical protein